MNKNNLLKKFEEAKDKSGRIHNGKFKKLFSKEEIDFLTKQFYWVDESSFSEFEYCLKNNIKEIPLCVVCGKKKTSFKNKEYNKVCSSKKCQQMYVSQLIKNNEELKNKRTQSYKENFKKKYGCESPLQLKEIKEKIKRTNNEKYGCDNPMQCEEIKAKFFENINNLYGVSSTLLVPEFREKTYKTLIEKYGVDNVSKNEIIKKKKEETTFKHFGVRNPMQCIEIFEKSQRSGKRFKTFTLKNGEEIFVQGYEGIVISFLEKQFNFKDFTKNTFLTISYFFDGKKRIYIPDLLAYENGKLVEVIEVKSTFTLFREFEKNLKKFEEAFKRNDFNFKLIVYEKGEFFIFDDLKEIKGLNYDYFR